MPNSFHLFLLCHVCGFICNFSQEYSSNFTPMTSTTAQTDPHCDISVINSMINFSFYESNQVPILIQNSLSHWPNYSKWYQTFSQQRVQISSTNSIVFSNGKAESQEILSQTLQQIESNRNLYVFDFHLLKENHSLRSDYTPPSEIQQHFESVGLLQNSASPVLSIGSTNSGFQFHTHGEAWLGLLTGRKDWILYPPGYHMPLASQLKWNPFLIPHDLSISRLDDILCHQQSDCDKHLKPIPPSTTYSTNLMDTFNSRPLICSQYPGDLIYLPAGWSHLTINPTPQPISQTISSEGPGDEPDLIQEIPNLVIGLGAQRIWDTAERINQCSRILFSSPLAIEELSPPSSLLPLLMTSTADYECYKSLGNIYKQKSIELLTQLSLQDNPSLTASLTVAVTEEKICLFLQYAIEFYRNAIRIRPLHPECRIQLIDALLKSIQTKSCLPLSSLSLQEIVTDTQTMLSGITPNISSSEELHTDLVSIAITYQRISSLLVTQMPLISISLLESALSLFSRSHQSISSRQKTPSPRPSPSYHPGYIKGLVQRVLLYERLNDISSALDGLLEMERVTPSHPMIPKTREYLLSKRNKAG